MQLESSCDNDRLYAAHDEVRSPSINSCQQQQEASVLHRLRLCFVSSPQQYGWFTSSSQPPQELPSALQKPYSSISHDPPSQLSHHCDARTETIADPAFEFPRSFGPRIACSMDIKSGSEACILDCNFVSTVPASLLTITHMAIHARATAARSRNPSGHHSYSTGCSRVVLKISQFDDTS
jgi:hypothetical protein